METGMVAVGGSTLGEHAASAASAAKLTSTRWDLVVLQEQSQIPSVDQLRQNEMYPAARRLADTIYRHGGRPIFFLTWAHRDGWPENGLPDYASMQSAIDQGYLTIAAEEEAAVAPVGVAWASVLSQAHPESSHNGGMVTFGPEGLLYVGWGDGGGSHDRHGPHGNAQSLGSPLGKILRINPRRRGRAPYSVPRDNPFVGRRGARAEIYGYGLRNPWRFSFDRATGDMVIADVGQDEFEELDFAARGGARVCSGSRASAPTWGRRRTTSASSPWTAAMWSSTSPSSTSNGATGIG